MRGGAIIAAARRAGRRWLGEDAGKTLLAEFGVPVPRSVAVPDAGCLDAAADLTPPFALKVISPDILHKSDVGGVALGLQDL
ncbi:MAG: acetate--CoA ligase family protein, partial [Methyloligellaceae bacterium]